MLYMPGKAQPYFADSSSPYKATGGSSYLPKLLSLVTVKNGGACL